MLIERTAERDWRRVLIGDWVLIASCPGCESWLSGVWFTALCTMNPSLPLHLLLPYRLLSCCPSARLIWHELSFFDEKGSQDEYRVKVWYRVLSQWQLSSFQTLKSFPSFGEFWANNVKQAPLFCLVISYLGPHHVATAPMSVVHSVSRYSYLSSLGGETYRACSRSRSRQKQKQKRLAGRNVESCIVFCPS